MLINNNISNGLKRFYKLKLTNISITNTYRHVSFDPWVEERTATPVASEIIIALDTDIAPLEGVQTS